MSNLVPFKPGQSGNPKGRPKGARNKLSEAFLKDLYAAWQVGGAQAISTVMADKPDVFIKIVASLVPKDLNFSFPSSDVERLTEDEIKCRVIALTERLNTLGIIKA